jgi:hypothetical protein
LAAHCSLQVLGSTPCLAQCRIARWWPGWT